MTSRSVKKLIAIRRARWRLEKELDRIDWELDHLFPEVDRLKELEATHIVELEVEAGDSVQPQDDAA